MAKPAKLNDTAKMAKSFNTIDEIDDLTEKIEMFQYTEKEYKFQKPSDILRLCDLLKGEIPAINLLKTRLENGCHIERQKSRWQLYGENGGKLVSGDSLKQILVALIFIDC